MPSDDDSIQLAGEDDDLLLEGLAARAPASKEELFLFAKHTMRFPCEACKGTGRYQTALGGWAMCEWCLGEKKVGMHFGRVAICPGHVAPLDVLWELWSGIIRHLLLIANRGGGKTRMLAVWEHLIMRFGHYSISHMGAKEAQANRARDYLHAQVSIHPWRNDLATSELGQEKLEFSNGAKIEWLPGTLAQASGPHNEVSVLDEVDEAPFEVRDRFIKTPTGPRAAFIEASTHYIQEGTISRILKEAVRNPIPVRRFCLLETIQRCEYACDRMPLPDGAVGRCPLYETEEPQPDGSLRLVTLCGGELARRADGHIPVPTAVANWLKSSVDTRRIEHLCQAPSLPIGSRAYWGFSPQVSVGTSGGNVLPWSPDPRPDAPLMWTMDFNPGRSRRMCSVVIQPAPPEFGQEWWIIDEIVLATSSTPETVREFLRRYGIGGFRLIESSRDLGHMGGMWIYGDATGHTKQSTTGETDYDVIISMMRGIHGFRLMVPLGSANPPMVDRVNIVNRLLWDVQGGTGKRWLKVAPRCVETIRELELMPLDVRRQKDKSPRVQLGLGLSDISDTIDYWSWTCFPNGPPTGLSQPAVLALGSRESVIGPLGRSGVAVGTRRASAGGDGMPSPWLTGRQDDRD